MRILTLHQPVTLQSLIQDLSSAHAAGAHPTDRILLDTDPNYKGLPEAAPPSHLDRIATPEHPWGIIRIVPKS